MKSLNHNDLNWIIHRTPKAVVDLLQANPKVFMAGGFIRSVITNEPVNDIDLFTNSKEASQAAANGLTDRLGPVHETDNAYSVKPRNGPMVQFIHRWVFETPEKCLDSFDFTIACAAIWHDGHWKSLCDANFYADLAAKRLVYSSPIRNEDAGGSMLRVLKFYQRGYRIPLDSLGAVIARFVGELDEDGVGTLMSREGKTREQATATVLTARLREVDPSLELAKQAHLPDTSGEAV